MGKTARPDNSGNLHGSTDTTSNYKNHKSNGHQPSCQMLDDGVSSLLQKGLNYAVTPRTIPIEDILAGVEKAVQSLPVEMAEEARQETVRIIKSSSRPKDNITKAERAALRTLKNNTDLTILLADKCSATVILNTVDYKQKITSLLEASSYRRLAWDPTD